MSARTCLALVALAGGVLGATSGNPAFAREEVAKLLPGDAPSGGSGFGKSVSLSGGYAAVGAPNDGDLGQDAGAVYVFEWDGMGWVQHAKLTASNGGWWEYFGLSVAIDGDRLVVGAPAGSLGMPGVGQAYVFRREGDSWIEEAILHPSYPEPNAFGKSVAIDGDLVVVSAPAEESSRGAFYVFRRNGTTWVQETRLQGYAANYDDGFALDVSISNDVIVAGAPFTDYMGSESGSVYVFRHDGEEWVTEDVLLPSDGAAQDWFGLPVAITGNALVVGAVRNDDAGSDSGSAYVFRYGEGGWTEEAKLTASDAAAGDLFGEDVAIDGNLVVAGAHRHDEVGSDSGVAYLFVRRGISWIEDDKLVPSDAGSGQALGGRISVDEGIALVGSVYGAYLFAVTDPIPALSSWGVLVMALLTLTAGVLVLRRVRPDKRML